MNLKDICIITAMCIVFAVVFSYGLIYQLDIEAAACEQQK